MKRMTAFFLAAILLLTLIPFAGATFTPEEKAEENKKAMAYAAAKGWIAADAAAQEPLARGEAEKLLASVGGKLPSGGEVTAAGLAKALLTALGYAKEEALSGDGWVVKTQQLLRRYGLNWYLDTTANVPVTRASAAQLAYNICFDAENAKIEPEAYKETTISFTDSSKYRLLGRALQTDDGVITDWSGDGIEFTISCRGVIFLTASTTYVPISYPAFRLIVDGKPWDWMQLKYMGTYTNPMAVNLPAGEHTIRIIKDSAIARSTEKLVSVTMVCKPETMKPTPQRAKFLEVIGDSTSSGAGAYLPTDNMNVTTHTTSAVLCYGYLAAEELGWDCELLVKGSMGVVKKTGSPVEQNYVTMYEYQNRYRIPDDPVKYAFPRKADVVTMKVSENDGSVKSEEWVPATLAFFETIRGYHGKDVPIVVMYYSGSKHQKDIEKIIADDPGVYGVMIRSNAGGAGGHPSVAAQQGYCRQLVDAIKALGLA